MQAARKIVLIKPLNQRGGSLEEGSIESEVKTDKIKTKIYDKIHRFIKVILKLARSVGYDEDLRIKLKNGKYLEKTNIVDLLTHAMSVGKVLYGENEFIDLLHESNVDPELIINDNVRLKLLRLKNRGPVKSKITTFTQREEPMEYQSQSQKRKLSAEMPTLTRGDQSYFSGEGNDVYVSEEPERPTKKRKINEVSISDEDSIDDSMIDSERWTV